MMLVRFVLLFVACLAISGCAASAGGAGSPGGTDSFVKRQLDQRGL